LKFCRATKIWWRWDLLGSELWPLSWGVEREFITREQGVERLEKITHFFRMPTGFTASGRIFWKAAPAK
jgi:hypothetical protein